MAIENVALLIAYHHHRLPLSLCNKSQQSIVNGSRVAMASRSQCSYLAKNSFISLLTSWGLQDWRITNCRQSSATTHCTLCIGSLVPRGLSCEHSRCAAE